MARGSVYAVLRRMYSALSPQPDNEAEMDGGDRKKKLLFPAVGVVDKKHVLRESTRRAWWLAEKHKSGGRKRLIS
jgi:hypothetical protein